MSRIEKLLLKARQNPRNLKFQEFQKLCEYFGFTRRSNSGGHFCYKHHAPPKYTLTIQSGKNGMAKPYQVRQLLDYVDTYLTSK